MTSAPTGVRQPQRGTDRSGRRASRLGGVADICRVARPEFWSASAAALYVGFVLRTHDLLPHGGDAVALGYAAGVVSPLVWLAVLAVNDRHDLANDLASERKHQSPVVQGRLGPDALDAVAPAAAGAAAVLSLALGAWFTAGVVGALTLGWLYSAPPVRLKSRPAADVAVNAFGLGVLGPVGGWTAVAGSPAGYPWPLAVIGWLAAAGLYVPTTIVDHEADVLAGDRTVSVALGRRRAFELGFLCWAASAVLATVLAAADVVIDRSLLPVQAVAVVPLLLVYRRLLWPRPSFGALQAVAALYTLPCLAFASTWVRAG